MFITGRLIEFFHHGGEQMNFMPYGRSGSSVDKREVLYTMRALAVEILKG